MTEQDTQSTSGGEETDRIRETDIVFDCPFCSKSLAIDYRGAGLTIPCSDCGNSVQVPIPEGMQISDLDSTGEEQEALILNMRRSLTVAEERIRLLEAEIDEMDERRRTLEKDRTDKMFKFGAILDKVGSIQESVRAISDSLKKIADMAGQEN